MIPQRMRTFARTYKAVSVLLHMPPTLSPVIYCMSLHYYSILFRLLAASLSLLSHASSSCCLYGTSSTRRPSAARRHLNSFRQIKLSRPSHGSILSFSTGHNDNNVLSVNVTIVYVLCIEESRPRVYESRNIMIMHVKFSMSPHCFPTHNQLTYAC
jgi:hypothetical protein